MKEVFETTETLSPFVYLFEAANEALEHAKQDEDGRFYDCLSCITFCALTLEAFFNHLGKNRFEKYWELIERKLNPSEKLEMLSRDLNVKINFGIAPFNDFKQLIKLRNTTAHGKTISEDITIERTHEKKYRFGETKWEKEFTLKNAQKYLKSTEEMINIIWKKANPDNPGTPFTSPSSYRMAKKRDRNK